MKATLTMRDCLGILYELCYVMGMVIYVNGVILCSDDHRLIDKSYVSHHPLEQIQQNNEKKAKGDTDENEIEIIIGSITANSRIFCLSKPSVLQTYMSAIKIRLAIAMPSLQGILKFATISNHYDELFQKLKLIEILVEKQQKYLSLGTNDLKTRYF